jgi:sugar phosphate isomerase/epimerase
MFHNHMTRREVIKTAGGLPLFAAASQGAGQESKSKNKVALGISTLGFPNSSNEQLAQTLAGQGIKLVQLFFNQTDSRYWQYNGRSDLSAMTAERSKSIAAAYRSAGISIHSLGVYTNLIHPDEAERKQNLEYFEDMMKIAVAMGVRYLITEAGHYHPEGPAPAVAYHFQEEVWKRTVATGKQLAARAAKYGVTVLLEPFFRGFFASAKRTRLFLEEVKSPRIRALLDPANILEINDLEEMFDQLSPWIDCLHAKDRKLHVDWGVPAGQGDLDYPKFVKLAAQQTPHAPLILEYVGPNDYLQALQHLRNTMRKVGVSEKSI